MDVLHFSSEKIKEAIPGTNGLLTMIATKVGCSYATLYNRMKEDPTIQELVDEEKEKVGDMIESNIYALAEEQNPQVLMFLCKTKLKNRGFVEKTETDINLKQIPDLKINLED